MVAGGVSLALARSLRLGLRISGTWRRRVGTPGTCRFKPLWSEFRHLRYQDAKSTCRMRLADEASETLGVRTVADGDPELNPESPFGAAGSGGVTAPKLPRLADDGGKVNADARTVLGGEGFAVSAGSTAVARTMTTRSRCRTPCSA